MCYTIRVSILAIVLLLFFGCTAKGGSPADKRRSIDNMAQEVLTNLYKIKPDVRSQIKNAAGFAVFSSANVNLIFFSASGGYGYALNNKNGRKVYMKMAEAGIGLGLGIKDFRAVFVFHDESTLNNFIDNGWQFGGHADAAVKAHDKGGATGGEIVIDNITIYQLTESGIALQATVKGTKYWRDSTLN